MIVPEHHTSVGATATAAALTSATSAENGSASAAVGLGVHPPGDFLYGISFRSALSGPGGDGLRLARLLSSVRTEIGRGSLGTGTTKSEKKIVDELEASGGRVSTCLHSDITWECSSFTARAMSEWRLPLEVKRERGPFEVAVPRGAEEHMGLTPRDLHVTGTRLALADCANAYQRR